MILFFRTIILYALVIIVMRLMGKRQIGQLQPFEVVVAIMISDLASVPMQNTGIPLVSGIIPILTLLACQLLISFVLLKSVKIRTLLCGSPTILIHKGKILESNLRKEVYTINDLIEAIRLAGYSDISEVETAVLETNGTVSIFPKGKYKTPTAEELSLSLPNEEISINLIIDGKLLTTNMTASNINIDDLNNVIKKVGGNSYKDVLLCTLKDKNNFFLQLKE